MNGLSFFGLNFLLLGAGSAYAFSFRFPLIIVSLLVFFIGALMILDDLRGQPIGQWVLSFFPGTKSFNENNSRNQPIDDNKDKTE